jgi:CTP synthase
VKIEFIEAEDIETKGVRILENFHGICIPGGFGTRGTEGMIMTARYAREKRIPYLGICLGSQIMAIEFARNVLGISDASSEEFSPAGKHNIIHIMEHQKDLTTKGANMRLGNYTCMIRPDTLAHRVYGTLETEERHRHRFEFDPHYRADMEKAGFIVSATSPDGSLAEIVELASRPFTPHPLFMGFLRAMINH